MIQIDEELCKGCDICINFCPKNVFETSNKINKRGYYLPTIKKPKNCSYCRFCELLCPEFAIILKKETFMSLQDTNNHENRPNSSFSYQKVQK